VSDHEPIGNADWLREFNIHESLPDGTVRIMSDNYPYCDYENCANEAMYYYRHQCCNTVSLGCELHTNGMMRLLIELHQNGTMAKCVFCKKHKIPLMLITRPQILALDKPGAGW